MQLVFFGLNISKLKLSQKLLQRDIVLFLFIPQPLGSYVVELGHRDVLWVIQGHLSRVVSKQKFITCYEGSTGTVLVPMIYEQLLTHSYASEEHNIFV